MRGAAHVSDHVKVLCEKQEVHDIFAGGTLDVVGKVDDRRTKTVHNGFSLFGDTDSAEVLGFGLSFGALDLENLVSLGALGDGILETLGAVNFVHGVLDPLIGIEVRDEGLQDLVAIARHGFGEGVLDGQCQVLLGFKDFVQLEGGQLRAHHVVDVRRDLLLWVSECVKGLIHLLPQHLILHRNDRRQEHIVQRLGLDLHIDLLHPKGQPSHKIIHGPDHTSQTRRRDPTILSPSLHNANLRRRNREAARNTHGSEVIYNMSNVL
mmetsp:Transcript_11442/g.20889  ORF Transcript_11442/g.20889 Transcript_11442/m.20889 type:complete len:265 (+) Transcript_11442:295-1089(+)